MQAVISQGRARGRGALALAIVLLAGIAPAATTAGRSSSAVLDPALVDRTRGVVNVIVRTDGSLDGPRAAVARAGGHVTRDLSIIDGFSATVPASAIDDLVREPGIAVISLDREVTLMDGGTTTTYPDSVYRRVVRADDVQAAGTTGAGVTVAVIDTGIADLPAFGGRVVSVTDEITGVTDKCINFSGEPGCADSYGHGTFVAGIIAGSGAGGGSIRRGVAPGARLLSVKLAGRDGGADVSTLLAAIQWVVSHREVYGIEVMNLSLGSDSPQSYRVDPLNYAVEKAWLAGITVVVAASNRGPLPGTVTKPGDDPFVITVGAVDDQGTEALEDDSVPDFSARGPTLADALLKPDLVAPGAHIVSLRAPGSAIDVNFPQGTDGSYRRGSGTSFATPVVAGTVALMLERNPSMTPDNVKFALMESARAIGWANPIEVGRGTVDTWTAVMAPPVGAANQGLVPSDGTGSLDASRGSLWFVADDPLLTQIEGDLTQQLMPFDSISYRLTGWSLLSWAGAKWHGAKWHGAKWHGAKWHGAKWHEAQDESESYGTGWLGSAIYGAWE